ncbi:putative serine/threonine-protein kinase B isoform X1 [Watersipora subatra]|uniref:putative serine/threonine-protein kinase B isoform X1 n=1 Tax=Watersipora subatra TaxID=2589382 RepID=UPI00355B6E48
MSVNPSIPLSSVARATMAGGKYTRIELLGEGSFGSAYLVKKNDDSLKYVIKEINLSKATPADKAYAYREVEVLRALFHPNIVEFKDSYQDGEKLCIVMQYCEKGNLYDKITKERQLREEEIFEWFVQLCKALEYMHSCRIVHRDLTPKNIFISQDYTLRVGDFGLAKRYPVLASRQASRQAIGAVVANAPEMLKNRNVKVSDKMDVWAAGGILYFMTMRKLVFVENEEEDTEVMISFRIADAEYIPIPETFSQDLRDTIAWLFTVKPEDRPSIRKVLASPAVSAYTNPADRLKKVYNLEWKEDSLLSRQGQTAQKDYHGNSVRDNKIRYEGIAELVTEELHRRMLGLGLAKFSVPRRKSYNPHTDHPEPDFDHPGTVIFGTPDYVVAEKLLVLIHGGGDTMRTRAGQWARRTMIYSKSIESGTQLPYIRAALFQGYGLIILNGNDKRPEIEGCKSFQEHALYVWENYVMRSEAAYVAIKSHSNGGSIVCSLYGKFRDHFREKVYANAFTGDGPVPMPIDDYTKKVSRSWVVSNDPVGCIVRRSSQLECYSAGTDEHSLTPHKAVRDVFKFIEERFGDFSPGNLQS